MNFFNKHSYYMHIHYKTWFFIAFFCNLPVHVCRYYLIRTINLWFMLLIFFENSSVSICHYLFPCISMSTCLYLLSDLLKNWLICMLHELCRTGGGYLGWGAHAWMLTLCWNVKEISLISWWWNVKETWPAWKYKNFKEISHELY